MNEKVRTDSLSILEGVIDILRSPTVNTDFLFDYSNKCIHNASIFQDQDSVRLAVIIYAIYKIHKRFTKINEEILKYLMYSKENLDKYDFEQYRLNFAKIIEIISKVSSLQPYISQVLEDAKIKKGAKLIDHGISVGQASEILGVSQWDMQNYLGKSGIQEDMNVDEGKKRLLKKLTLSRKMFGIKK